MKITEKIFDVSEYNLILDLLQNEQNNITKIHQIDTEHINGLLQELQTNF